MSTVPVRDTQSSTAVAARVVDDPADDRLRRAGLAGDALFVAFCVTVTVIRARVLLHPYAPPGVDPGNWLAYGHALFGEHIRSSSVVYPPAVPVLVLGSVKALGPTIGVVVVALGAALAPSAVMYILLRREIPSVCAAIGAGFLAAAASTGEPAAWGGYPQLFGLAIAIVFLTIVHRYWSEGRRRLGYVAGALLVVLAATSYLLVAPAVGAALVLYMGVRRDRRVDGSPPLRQLVIGLMPGLLLLPIYIPLTAAFIHNLVFGSAGNVKPASIPSAFHLLFRDWELFWWTILVLALLTPLFLVSRRFSRLWQLTTAWFLASTVLLLALPSERTRIVYFFPIGVALALGCWMQYFGDSESPNEQRLGRAFVVGLALALALESAYGLRFFPTQRHFYGLLTPKLVSAIEWIGHRTDSKAVIAVSPVRELALGWWVEGLVQRRTLTASRIDLLTYDDERHRALEANRIFRGPVPDVTAARRYAAGYVLLAKASERFDPVAFQLARPGLQSRIVYENADAVVLKS